MIVACHDDARYVYVSCLNLAGIRPPSALASKPASKPVNQ